MARVRELRIYPVKGLDPVSVSAVRVLPSGALEFDRRWALFDARGNFINGKNRPALHAVRAAFDMDRGEIRLDSGTAWSLSREAGAVERWFAGLLGEPVTLRENPGAGFPDDTDSPGPTIASEASFAAVAGWFGFTPSAVRLRFRANIEIAGVEAWWEDRLYGSRFQIGATRFTAVNPCARCVVPSRDAHSGEPAPGFQKRFMELRREHLPAAANAALFDHTYRFAVNTRLDGGGATAGTIIRIGDPLAA